MNLFKIELPYGLKLNAEQLLEIQQESPKFRWRDQKDIGPTIWESDTDEVRAKKKVEKDLTWNEYLLADTKEVEKPNSLVVDLTVFANKYPWLKFTVLEAIEVKVEPKVISVQHEIDALNETFQRFKELEITQDARTFNSRCDVHIGGSLLIQINELMLCEDSCTDDIQSRIDGGWRIVSVCVQPDGRRPDYILGRFNPEKESGNCAERG